MAKLNTRIGVFGGTFDPPHVGHQILASEALEILELDTILWVLTPDPPHKTTQEMATLSERLEMVNSAIENNETFRFSEVDIKRPAPHYALDTVNLLHNQYPDSVLCYLMGGDSLVTLPDWHKPKKLVAACDEIGVMCRPGNEPNLTQLENELPGISKKVKFISAPLLEISSSRIRNRIAQGRGYRYFLPDQVYKIIESHHLYR